MTASAPRSLAVVRKELRELLQDMQLLWQQPGTGFDAAYNAAKRKAQVLAREYAALLEASKDG